MFVLFYFVILFYFISLYFLCTAESLKITKELLSNHTLPPIFVKQYTMDADNTDPNIAKQASADMLAVSRMAAQYCLDSDERMDAFSSSSLDDATQSPDASTYLHINNVNTVVTDLSANIAIAMSKQRRLKRTTMAASSNANKSTSTTEVASNDSDKDVEALNTAMLAASLDKRAMSMFGY